MKSYFSQKQGIRIPIRNRKRYAQTKKTGIIWEHLLQ